MASLSSPRIGWPLGTFRTTVTAGTLGTKLRLLALSPSIPLAIICNYFNFGSSWVFVSSLLGLALLSERLIVFKQQVVCLTGPADVVKYYLLDSIVSNLLLLLGVCLYHGAIVKLRNLQKYDKRQVIVNSYMLLALLCHLLPISFRINVGASVAHREKLSLSLPIASSITMLIIYFGNIVFQLRKKYNQSSEAVDETRVMSLWSGIVWLVTMITLTVLLSKYMVDTIEDASNASIRVDFLSILLSTVGNIARHKGDTVFNFTDKMLDISFSVTLNSVSQISTYLVPLCVTIAWVMGIKMDHNFNLPETGFLTLAIAVTAFPLQGWLPSFLLERKSNRCLVKMEKKNLFLLVSIVTMVFFSCGVARPLQPLDREMPKPGPNPCTTVPGRNQGHCIDGMNIGGRTISPPTPPPISS